VQGATIVSAMNFFFRGGGLLHGDFWGEASVSVEGGAEFFATVEVELGELDWGEFFGFDALG